MRIVLTLCLFLLLGPPVGFLSVVCAVTVPQTLWAYTEVHLLHTLDCERAWRSECLFLTAPLSALHSFDLGHWVVLTGGVYVFGAIPALFAGLLIVQGMLSFRTFGIVHIVGTGCVVGIVLALITLIGPNNRSWDSFVLIATTLGLIPTVVCALPIWLWSRGASAASDRGIDASEAC